MVAELDTRAKYYRDAAEAEEAADDEFDPFASESEGEDAAAAAAAMKAKAAAKATAKKDEPKKKKVVISKSSLVIEVRPGSSDTDLDVVARMIKEITMEGVTWAESPAKKVPLAFGLMKLQVGCTIIDDLVQTDKICENIETLGMTPEAAKVYIQKRDDGTLDEDDDDEDDCRLVQAAEIVSFNKL